MKIITNGRGIKVSSYLEDLVDKKLNKIGRYFKNDENIANVVLSVEKNRQICEITIPIKGAVLRANEVSGDMYASIDGCVDKIERQLKKHRDKLEKRLHTTAYEGMPEVFQAEEVEKQIVRTKEFDMRPMDIDEAALHMELLGHSFFVFRNVEGDAIQVLYLRDDGDLGLIKPRV